jgi:hypothetical protein
MLIYSIVQFLHLKHNIIMNENDPNMRVHVNSMRVIVTDSINQTTYALIIRGINASEVQTASGLVSELLGSGKTFEDSIIMATARTGTWIDCQVFPFKTS